MKLWVLIGGCVALTGGGQVLLKYGLRLTGELDLSNAGLLAILLRLVSSWALIAGLACYVASMIVWIRILSEYDLSYVYPLFVCTAFIFVLGLSWALLREPLPAIRLLGVVLMCTGIFLASRSAG